MNIMKNKTLLLALMTMICGLTMIFGSSYALIAEDQVIYNNRVLSEGNIIVNFEKDNTISLVNSFPITDQEGLTSENEFSFTVNNLGNYTTNYSLSILETSPIPISETIRITYNLNDYGYVDVSTLNNNNIISQNRILEAKKTDYYKIKFWIKEDALSSYVDKSFSAKIILKSEESDYKYATDVISKLAEENLNNIFGINSDGNISNNNIREYRYIGSNVPNYIWFNCEEGYTKGINHCEKWRIIGSFDNTWKNGLGTYKTLKIIRDTELEEKVSFSNNNYKGDYGSSYLNYYANNDYYNSLSLSAKNMILNAKWNIGITNPNVDTNESYKNEIKEFIYGDIGIISLSDYMFAGDNYNNNWLSHNNELLTINLSNVNTGNINIIRNGIIENDLINKTYDFIPCVYLKPDVSIISGDGTIEKPYEIGIKFPMIYDNIKYVK